MPTPANPRQRRIPEATRAAVVEMMRAGISASEAAAMTGVHHTSALAWARAAGVPVLRRGRPASISTGSVAAIRRDLASGASAGNVARARRVSRRTVRDLGRDPSRRLDAIELPACFEIPEGVELTPEERAKHDQTADLYRLATAMLTKAAAE